MTDDDASGSRRRMYTETAQTLVPEYEVARAIEKAKEDLRREWAANVDRIALERAAKEATDAARGSRRRFMTALSLIAILAVAIGMQFAYGRQNRERIERLERISDERRAP